MTQQKDKLTYLQRKSLDFFFTKYSNDVWKTLVTFKNPYILDCDIPHEIFKNISAIDLKLLVKQQYSLLKKIEANGYLRALTEGDPEYVL